MKLLEGIKVVENAGVITGPFAGQLLADLGATVLKVEAPSGDAFRAWEGVAQDVTPTFAAYNRGKQSISLDLKQVAGKEVYRRLAAEADVVIENFRPGVADRLGVGYEQLKVANPSLVYCYISGMGTRGPDSARPTYDAIAQALSGLWSQVTDLAAPEAVGPPMSDQLTAIFAAMSVLAGIQSRTRTGHGVKVEVNMLASSLAFQPAAIASLTREGQVPERLSRARASQSYGFVASDGKPFAIHLSTPHKFWQALCRAIDRPELVSDPRFAQKDQRIQRYDELGPLLQEVFASEPRDVWVARLRAEEVPCAPINTLAEALEEPQVRAIDAVSDGEGDGRLRGLVKSPVSIEGVPLASELPPPGLGENSRSILEDLGFSEREIEELYGSGSVR